jgi:hypothetical protein
VCEFLVLYSQLVHMSTRVISQDEVDKYICTATLRKAFEAILHGSPGGPSTNPHTYFVVRRGVTVEKQQCLGHIACACAVDGTYLQASFEAFSMQL